MNLSTKQIQTYRCRKETYGYQCFESVSHSLVYNFLRPHGLWLPGSLTMEFSKEYWSGQPFPSPGNLPQLGTEPGPPALQADSLLSDPPGKEAQGESRIGKNWKIGIDIYTLLCMKQITNMDLLYSTGNFAQYFAMAYMGKEY